ncbi:class I SAM-dependent methyltransferase [Patescibacteria group bacterium]|nr:class I SAM-dependent methyltransferase [Patescibacteria group bacterium]
MRKKTREKLLNIVKQNYSEIATDFDTSRKKYLWPEMEKFSELVFEGAKILDAGCGNGRLLEAFNGKKVDYSGFDLSPELISFAKENYPKQEFFVDDLLKLENLPEKKYDFIFLIAVILHIPDRNLRAQVLKSLADKLEVGGRIILSVWDFYGQKRFDELVRKSETKRIFSFDGREPGDLLFLWTSGDGKSKSQRYYHAFKDKELKNLAKSAGLELEEFYKSGKNIWLVLRK